MIVDYKNLTLDELNTFFSDIKFKTKPFKHQLASIAFSLAEDLNRVMFWHDIGTGKTLTALYLLQCWNVKGKILIICPNSVIRTWKEEIEKHTDFTYTVLDGCRKDRWTKLTNAKTNIFIINYEGLKLIGADKGEKSYKLNRSYRTLFGFEVIIADECHHFKDPTSLQCKITACFTEWARYTILLTGTPMSKSVQDLFGQYFVLDNGKTLGNSYYYFLLNYFYKPLMGYKWEPKHICAICGKYFSQKKKHLEEHKITIQDYRKRYGNDKTTESVILEKVKKNTLKYDREECVDLPEKMYEVREVEQTDEQIRLADTIFKGLKFNELTKKQIEYNTHKLLQISSGFLLSEGQVIEKLKVNPKLDELKEIIPQIKGKAIIYHQYLYESTMITTTLSLLGEKCSVVNGQITDKEKEINSFLKNDNVRFLVAHPKSGGEGLNFQNANTVIFFNSGMIGTILRNQSEGRIWRTGQKNACLFIDIVMKNTADEVLYLSLKNNEDYVQGLYSYFQKKTN